MAGHVPDLTRLLANLVDNAIRYTPNGGSVDVSVKAVGSDIELVVADTGVGIPAEHLPHVFGRFYRVDQTRTPGQDKTSAGLGLAICQQIVEAHGGTIELESELGDGSRFIVRLPLQ